nr:glycosyltransferase [Psychromicrobium silvestre]
MHVVNDAETGGAQTLIEALGRQKSPGDEFHLLVLMTEGALSSRFSRIADSVTYAGMKQRDLNPLGAIRALRGIVRERRIDLIHSHLMQSDLISLLTPMKAARLSTVHSSASYETRGASQLVRKAVVRLSGRFDAVVACSPSAHDYLSTSGYRRKAETIFNGTLLQTRSDDPATPGDRLVHLGRWHQVKDHGNLFAALKLLSKTHPQVRLDCAGLGIDSANQELQELLVRHQVADIVTTHGSVSQVGLLLEQAKGMVISSSHEALPMAGIEALGSGLPVVTTDVGDCSELAIGPDYLVPARNPEQLAAALAKLLDLEPTDYRQARENARALAEEKFDERVTAASYHALYQAITHP